MASPTLIISPELPPHILIVAGALALLSLCIIIKAQIPFPSSKKTKNDTEEAEENANAWASFAKFFYASFLKPHDGDGAENGQQDALESFYKAQAGVYDATRSRLLRGREDMLALVAAQLRDKAARERTHEPKRIWVDIGGGTGWNIEAMSEYVSVPEFFSSIYLVDFSPSLCDVARRRFKRLGWTNVKVVCQDARSFRLDDHEDVDIGAVGFSRAPEARFLAGADATRGADLVTLSYSLSMIPDFYSVIDSLANLLARLGNNRRGGFLRPIHRGSQLSKLHRRRDQQTRELAGKAVLARLYRFGTVLSADSRNYLLGSIPYYMWLGCHKKPASSLATPDHPHEIVERLDAAATESPYLSPINHTKALSGAVDRSAREIRSKAFEAAIVNLSANLPLPSFFYQNHHWRIHYDDQLKKHTQFNQEYIYAFTWEDSRVDHRLLNITPDDIILAITSAGDNILSYALQSPRRLHAIDLNPNQNHLLELKTRRADRSPLPRLLAALRRGQTPALPRPPPHPPLAAPLLPRLPVLARKRRRLLPRVPRSLRIGRLPPRDPHHPPAVPHPRIQRGNPRPAVLQNAQRTAGDLAAENPPHNHESAVFLPCRGAGILPLEGARGPAEPAAHAGGGLRGGREGARGLAAGIGGGGVAGVDGEGGVELYGSDAGSGVLYGEMPSGVFGAGAHRKLGRRGAFDGLRIHTDEIGEVVRRMAPGTLTIAVLMDSMDWFEAGGGAAEVQIRGLNRALRMGGRVLLRSAALRPWYIAIFETLGFAEKRVGARMAGACIDRVNMYASCYLLTKVEDLEPSTISRRQGSIDLETLEI
ncbi:hypothetical protein DID88_008845 [Monilinia fructigena]|uniref:Methyltransferase domain-containing protein n=1 Tax=Monilinia fructigena TaxID=38457 RepID=A0A395J913_9HELO|nr:hypothetical protein DID88_008845 [Monilinia fructigena]